MPYFQVYALKMWTQNLVMW